MEIKRHKIKVSSERQTSGFVLDLRLKQSPIKAQEKQEKLEKLDRQEKIEKQVKQKEQEKQEILSIFKFFKTIIFFFVDWAIDIASFFKKYLNFKRLPKNKKKAKIVSENFKKTAITHIASSSFGASKRKRSIWFFILFLFILIIPFKLFSYYKLVAENGTKDNLLNYSFSGLQNFISASKEMADLDLSTAQKDFFQAGEDFLFLDEELKKIDEFVIFLASFSGDEKIKLASESKKIAKIGIYLASAGDNSSLAIDNLVSAFSEGEVDVNKKFSDFYYYAQKAEDDFKKVNKYLKKIDESSLPEEYRGQFIDIKNKAENLEKNLSDFVKIIPGLKDFLAVESDKRYLIVFQNNAEARATGGFIGSYALLDLKKGKIKNIEVPAGGSYDTQGGMKVLVESPQALHLLKPTWYFWDANWWPDWKMSAQNLMWFYEKSGGPSVDGVISITPDVLADVLKIIGPIDLTEKYGVVVDSENFWEVIQEIVEVTGQPELYQDKELKTDILNRVAVETKNTDEVATTTVINATTTTATGTELFLRNEPKKIIGDLMSKIMGKFSSSFNRELLIKTIGIMEENLTEKNILLYFENEKMQAEVENRSWAGRIKNAPLDYLMVVNSSVAGGKTDYFIDNNYSLKVEIEADGSIVNKLTIKRKHQGISGNLFSGIRNIDWLRVYTPAGSSLISATGYSSLADSYFKKTEVEHEKNNILETTENKAETDLLSGTKIYQEAGKTVFANWSIVDPGEEAVVELTYKLPYNYYELLEKKEFGILAKLFPSDPSQNYSLLWQKQAGAKSSDLLVNFSSDLKVDPVWTYPDNLSGNFSQIKFKGNLNSDRYFVIMLK